MEILDHQTDYQALLEKVKQENEELRKSHAEKDKFFTILAHDLRSPLSSFMGLAEVMSEDAGSMSTPEIEEISKSLHESATNVFMLLENLLEWSILRRGLSEFHPVETELKRIIFCGLDSVFESARRKNIELEINVDEHILVVCDERMAETTFRNLVSNALKYTNKYGKVSVSATPFSDQEVLVTIEDNGIGMSKDIMDRLFLLSEQVNRKGTEGESSSGLGLIICKEFIERQGGEIWIESGEGKGSTFRFTLKKCI